MNTNKDIQIYRSIAILVAFGIVSLILWSTYDFFQKFKHEERAKMEILAKGFRRLSNADLDADLSLENDIIQSNDRIPMIVTDKKGNILLHSNLDSVKALKAIYLKKQLLTMQAQNVPIEINLGENTKQYIYYKDSNLLTQLKYYPLALLLILVLFGSVIYLFFKSNKIAEQNRLWSGMAKETAHQIGTPLTSLLGWIEILRMDNTSEETIVEIEKDVDRLNTIADRFSKIGSIPKLEKENIVTLTKNSFDYLQARSSQKIQFQFQTSSDILFVNSNKQLYSWVIENLVKNAIDAMQGKGILQVSVEEKENNIFIRVTDSGKGIPKNIRTQIFSPGFTTKKRGWGLGLSLSKRIIEDYHKGKIYIKESVIDKGTTFCIQLKRSE